MKLSLVFKWTIVMLLPLYFFSCGDNEQKINESLLRTIAMDEIYVEYQEKEEQHQMNIASGFYDMNALSEYFSSHPDSGNDICSTKDSELNMIKGGEDYMMLECGMHRLKGEVMKKYPDVNFDQETIMQVYFAYRQINKEYPATKHLANEFIQNKK